MKKKDEIKVCLVGSSGGHLTHLYMLKPFWKDKNRFWVTFDKEDGEHITTGDLPIRIDEPSVVTQRQFQLAQTIIDGIVHIKYILQKSETTHRPSQSINVPIKPPSTPHHPPGGAHLGRANAPGGSSGPRTLRRSSTIG